jgi:2,3-dihydroxybenzoate decarboxylase
MGADHVLPGTDYPFKDISVATEFQRNALINAIYRAKIAHLNAEKTAALP